MMRAGVLRCQHLNIVQQLAASFVDANGVERFTVGLGAGHPDLIARNHWRGPALAGHRCFPGDVFTFLPVDGNARLV